MDSIRWVIVTVAAFALGYFFRGFMISAGKDAYDRVKQKFKDPEPQQVASNFKPELFEPAECVWVPELNVLDRENQGYTYYPDHNTDGPCYRIAPIGDDREKREFLMVRPGASPKVG